MHELNDKNLLLNLLRQGAGVITPNNRLSAALLRDFFAFCNSKTVNKPSCSPYGTTLVQVYHDLIFHNPEQAHPSLLNEAQCQHLWKSIIQATAHITYSEGLLNAVMEAYKHSQQWQILPENQAFHYTPQTRQFQQWWQLFDKKLKELHLINEHQLIPYLIDADFLHSSPSLFFQPVIWVCFDEFTPQQLSFQAYLNSKGLEQFRYEIKTETKLCEVLAAKDNKEEYQQLISWLNLKISQNKQGIGVVIPNLQQESRRLQRIMQQHFNPSLFDISLGQTLNEFPLVSHALAWLNLEGALSPHQVSLLLQSPYIGAAKEEFLARSQYLQDSTLIQDQSVSLSGLIRELNHAAPKLAALLEQILPFPKEASVQEWIGLFQKRLHSLGFPGDYGLNSHNYQCFNRFTAVFDEFSQLHLISDTFSLKEALEAFAHLTRHTIFQAQKKNARIQISGLLEASGCEFDCLWIMGLSDQCLPQKTRLSAFIPPLLQRELAMPHSIPARELQFAQQTLQRLKEGSTEIVFSYACFQNDHLHLPCFFITDFPSFKLLDPLLETEPVPRLLVNEENYDLPLRSNESISANTALLANQAKCPFKAFAEHRLKAKTSYQTSFGLDNKERGQLIHKVMELFWQKIRSQQDLFHLSTAALNQEIEAAIHTALAPLKQEDKQSFPDLILEVESNRLKELVIKSLEWEKKRPPFHIIAVEKSYSIPLAGLEFTIRIDRMDQVEDKKWVIDYKSSLPVSKPWNEERPKEPQLLLYALLNEPINALLFLQLKTGAILCGGLSEEKTDIPGLAPLKKGEIWEEHKQNWEEQLTSLAKEFQQGYCPPQPLHQSLCQQCDFQNLCRFSMQE